MKLNISLVFVSILAATGCAATTTVSAPVSTPAAEAVMPGSSWVELNAMERTQVARAETATALGRPNTRFTCSRTTDGNVHCSQGRLR